MNLTEKFAYMMTGKPYNDLDPLLIEAREAATDATAKLNQANDTAERSHLFTQLVGSTGHLPEVNPNFHCEFGRNIHVGNNFYANYDCTILDGATVTIGDSVLFGPKVGLYTSNHLFDPTERQLGGCVAKPITIGNRCWLAANVTVLPGVSIGDGTIIGAGSVVTHSIPANVIAAGNPCQVLKKITDQDKTGFAGHDLI